MAPVTRKLEDILETLIDYRGRTPIKTESGVRLITAKVIKDGRITDTSFEYIAEEEYDTWMRRGLPRRWDILITTEAPLGEVAQIRMTDRVALAQRVILLRANPKIADQTYLFQALRSPSVQAELEKRSTGTTVPGIKQRELRLVEIPWFTLPLQRRIGQTLAAYDDLIENNTRRIAILEEMARALYREWFIEFRFPGHKNTARRQSPLGLIPSAWNIQTTAETFQYVGGSTPSKSCAEYWDQGTINWFTPTDLTRSNTTFVESSASRITPIGLQESSARLFPPRCVMMTSRATIGAIGINTTPACTNQGFITCIPSPRFPLYLLYHWLQHNVDYFISISTGSTFKELTRTAFKAVQVIVPTMDVASLFQDLIEPVGNQILALQRQNANLRATRDMLLPRLISGELDVSRLPDPGAAA